MPGARPYDQALNKLSRSVKLPGFRKGKVPRAVLQQRIGQVQIQASALEDLVDNVFREASSQEKIVPISRPELRGGFRGWCCSGSALAPISPSRSNGGGAHPLPQADPGLKAEAEPVVFEPARVDELIEQSRRQLACPGARGGGPAAMDDVAQLRFRAVLSTPVSRSAAAAAMAWRWSWRTAA